MRDRSWTPRRETSSRTRRGYTYGADGDGRGFYVATSVAPGSEDGTDEVIGGYLLQDGEVVPVTGGERRVARDDQHRPSGVVLEMATANGMTAVSGAVERSEEHTSELQSLMRISYAVFCLTKKNNTYK